MFIVFKKHNIEELIFILVLIKKNG